MHYRLKGKPHIICPQARVNRSRPKERDSTSIIKLIQMQILWVWKRTCSKESMVHESDCTGRVNWGDYISLRINRRKSDPYLHTFVTVTFESRSQGQVSNVNIPEHTLQDDTEQILQEIFQHYLQRLCDVRNIGDAILTILYVLTLVNALANMNQSWTILVQDFFISSCSFQH